MKNFETSGQEIAIVGMAGRFPQARTTEAFWQNIRDGVEAISFFSDQELSASGIDPGVFNHPDYVKAYGALEDIEWFDAPFFGFSPREAATLDPQQRLFLECPWEALENAGYDSESYPGRIGVYAGAGRSGYLLRLLSNPDLVNSVGENQIVMGNEKDFLSTRTSYKLNLNGPSMSVQTACSTSLVAVHLACQSLLMGESDMALAGGVSIHVVQKAGYLYQEGAFRSPDGHCRAFDARAGGFVGGSGVGIVVLKRLMDAIADGDCITAVIKGSALNNDGSLKIGYTAPSADAQAQVIAEALGIAGIEPETITYIETHGAGTPLGDPIEVAALTQAFRARTTKNGYCAIGSVKTNVGHLDTASGVAGLIKTALALKYRLIPPSLNFEEPNPKIDFANSPFYVNSRLTEWKAEHLPRRAGVSSFGIGGTNAHLVLEEAPALEKTEDDRSRPWQLLLLSAKTSSALEAATTNLAEHLKAHPDLDLADVAYTYRNGRRAFRHRRIVVCRDSADAVAALETRDPRRLLSADQESQSRSVVFLFPGPGAQYSNMGLELYQHEPVFREQVDRCAELLVPHLGLDLRAILYPVDTQVEAAAQHLRQTSLALPALFVTNYALAKLWMAWGVRPRAMIGHSLGEYVAAYLAGVFSLSDALGLVALRGRMLEGLPEGAMLSLPLSRQQVEPLLQPGLSLAAVNGPALCVVSGAKDVIAELETTLTRTGLDVRYVPIDTAAHSAMVTPILEQFTQAVAQISLHAPHLPYISNVTGTWITAQEATSPSYWAAHLRQTVRFADGIHTLLQEPDQLLLEVGPGHMLSMLARQQTGKTSAQLVFSSLRSTREQKSELLSLLTTAGQLWLAGAQVDWSGFSAHERRQRLPLPTYPFERKRYWIEQQPRVVSQAPRKAEARAPEPESAPVVAQKQKADPDSSHTRPDLQTPYVAPSNEIEVIIADFWQELLEYRTHWDLR